MLGRASLFWAVPTFLRPNIFTITVVSFFYRSIAYRSRSFQYSPPRRICTRYFFSFFFFVRSGKQTVPPKKNNDLLCNCHSDGFSLSFQSSPYFVLSRKRKKSTHIHKKTVRQLTLQEALCTTFKYLHGTLSRLFWSHVSYKKKGEINGGKVTRFWSNNYFPPTNLCLAWPRSFVFVFFLFANWDFFCFFRSLFNTGRWRGGNRRG